MYVLLESILRMYHSQIEHINDQTKQLVDSAMTTVQAVEADKTQHDAADTVQIVKVTASVIAKLAPVLIQTAREASSNQSSMESLNLISQEWATNVSTTCYFTISSMCCCYCRLNC